MHGAWHHSRGDKGGWHRGFGHLGHPGWGDLVANACGLPGPAERFGLVQLQNVMPEAAKRGRRMTNVNSTFQHGMNLESAYGATRAERSDRITQSIKYEKTSELLGATFDGTPPCLLEYGTTCHLVFPQTPPGTVAPWSTHWEWAAHSDM